MAKKKNRKPPAKAPEGRQKEQVRQAAPKVGDEFDELDDFFFGSQTGQFQRDEFDYDPFEEKSGSHDAAEAEAPVDPKATRMVMDVPQEVLDAVGAKGVPQTASMKADPKAGDSAGVSAQPGAKGAAAAKAQAQAQAQAKQKAEAEAEAKAKAEAAAAAKQKAEAAAKAKADAEAKAKADAEAKKEAAAEERRLAAMSAAARKKEEAEAKKKAAAEAKREREEEAARVAAEKAEADRQAEAKRKADAEEKLQAEAEAKRQAEAEAKSQAEEQRKAAAAAKRRAELEAEEAAATEDDPTGLPGDDPTGLPALDEPPPISERRAAGAAAAAAMGEDIVIGGGDDEGTGAAMDASGAWAGAAEDDDDESTQAQEDSQPTPADGTPAVASPEAPLGASDWATAVGELEAEAKANKGKKGAETRAVLHFEIGRILAYRMGDWAAAEEAFRASLKAQPTFVPALRELVRLAVSRTDWERAVELLETQAKVSKDPVAKTAALLASAHIELSELKDRQDDAAASLRAALEVYPNNYTALRFLRVIHYDREDYTKLVSVLEEARALAGPGEQLRIDYELGRVHDEVLKDQDAALVAFRRALQQDGRLIPAFLYAEQLLGDSGDKPGLVGLWREAATAWGGADTAWWSARAARMGDAAGETADSVSGDWKTAIGAAGVSGFLHEEYRQWLGTHSRSDELYAACEEALATSTDARLRASLCTILGRIALRVKGDASAATGWFDEALEADASCVAAREGLRQVVATSKDWEGLLGQLQRTTDAASSTRVKLALHLKMAEIALDRREDAAAARGYLEGAVELAPNYLPAVDSLATVLGILGDAAGRAERLEQAANLVDSDEARSTYLLRASRAWNDAGDRDRSVDALRRAADHGPGSLLAREWLVEAHVAAERWSEAAETLKQAAAETEDAALRVSLLYRSARIALAHAGDEDAAEAAYRSLRDLVPDFLPATMDLRDLYLKRGDWDSFGLLQQQEAESAKDPAESAWWNISAGEAYDRAGRVQDALARYGAALEAVPGHPVAHAALRNVYRSTGDWQALADDLGAQLRGAADSPSRDALRLQFIAALEQVGDAASVATEVSELLKSDQRESVPLPAMGILCEGLQGWDQAVAVYAAVGDTKTAEPSLRAACLFQQGLLLEEGFEDLEGAAALYDRADELVGHHPMALENLETIFGNRGERSGLASVYGRQAERAGSQPVRTFYALLAGDDYERLGDVSKAIAAYRVSFADPVGRERAYEALRRITMQSGDAATLQAVTAELAGDGNDTTQLARWMELGDGLVSMGLDTAALDAFAEVVMRDSGYIGAWYQLERLHRDREDWNGVLEALEAIAGTVSAASVKKAINQRIEQLLEDKGVTNDSAWDFYEKAYADDPSNVVALRGLGGISLSRGEIDDARLYYGELVDKARDPALLAEAETQLGDIARDAGDSAEAVERYEKALGHVSDHRPTLASLRTIHEAAENWQALVGVVAREASANPESRVQLHAEIARLWQDRIKEPRIAVPSWLKVLQEDPSNAEALERLHGLYESSGDWRGYLDVADRTLGGLSGVAARDRQAELGVIAFEKAGLPDRAVSYLRAAISGDQPSVAAIATLRQIYRGRGDWEQVIILSEQQAELVSDSAERVSLFTDAARIKLDQLLDRDGAAGLYERAIALDPSNADALAFFVDYYYDAEDWEKAAPVFEEHQPVIERIDLEDEDERMEATAFYYKYGTLLVKLGDPELTAIDKFGKALEMTPTHLPSLEAAAPRYFDAQEWGRARDACRAILRLRGGTGEANTLTTLYLRLGSSEIELGDTKNSLKRFKKVLDLSPNHIDALLGIARVHRTTEEWNSLLSTYNSIIKYARDPDQVIQAYLTKGDVLERKLSFTDKAVLHYEKVLMYDKNNVSAMTRLGHIALKRGDGERALEFGGKAVGAARADEDRQLGTLLEALAAATEPIAVDALLAGVREKTGDSSVLTAFADAIGSTEATRAQAANAFAEAFGTI